MGVIKNSNEIRLLRKAARISNSCIPLIEKSLKEDITELGLARRIRRKINSQGAALSFQTLVASGKRSAMIHPKPHASDQKISGLGFVDFGASYKGYKADVTVPFVKGKVGKKEWRIIKATLGAYNKSVKSLKIGMECWRAHYAAEKHLNSYGFKMQHAVGHGLGKKVHENPLIVMPRRKLKGRKLKIWERIKRITFQPGMVFTIEPGVYVKGIGGCRIENDFLASGKSFKALTCSKLLKV